MPKDKDKDKDQDFFQQEAAFVIEAMKRRSKQTLASLKTNTDARPWIQKRPLTSVVAAAAGGLVAGWLLVPPLEKRAAQAEAKDEHAPRHHTLASHLENEAFRALRPALRAFAASAAGALFANVHIPFASGHSSPPSDDLKGIPRQGLQI